MPLVPDGPIRHFYERLHDLHLAAGQPSMRELRRATRDERRPTGINPTTIHDAFAAPRLARWEVVREIVLRLNGSVEEFAPLWRAAWEAQARGADPGAGQPIASEQTTVVGQPAVPRELPPGVFAFSGRGDQLKRLDELLTGERAAVVIVAITGTAGVGKTALALHWAHRSREHFPDGQLYADLRGYARGEPAPPTEVLARFLRSLGVAAEDIPADQEAATARYRSMLAERRMLVLLDNAADAAQVRPLLPAGRGCLALVTGRDRLSGLVARDGARRVTLDVLSPADAQALLTRLLGAERVATEPDAATELAHACGYLPLALRLAAAGLQDHPGTGIAEHAGRLRRDRLGALEVDDVESGVRSAFELSYRTLSPAQRRMFRLSGLIPGPELSVAAAAALTGVPADEAHRLLERLAAAHLLTEPTAGRYGCHDLLRQYAAERAEAEETPADRQAALDRLLDWYLLGADTAARLRFPHRLRLPVPPIAGDPPFGDEAGALAWLDAERPNLVAAVSYAARHGPRQTAWLLADTLRSYLWLRLHVADLVQVTDAALRAARAEADPRAEAATLLSRSNIDHRGRRYAAAVAHCGQALALAERSGWVQGQAAAFGILATVHRDAGELADAAEVYGQALELYRAVGSANGEALTLHHLGRTYGYLGRLDEATESLTEAVTVYQRIGSPQGEGTAVDALGEICSAGGRPDKAMEYHRRALALAREHGDRGAEAYSMRNLAAAHLGLGQLRQALELAGTAAALARELGDIRIEADARNTLAAVHHALGRDRDAETQHQEVLDLIGPTGDPFPQIEAYLGLAACHRRMGHLELAVRDAREAHAMAHRTGYRLLEGRARTLAGILAQASAGS